MRVREDPLSDNRPHRRSLRVFDQRGEFTAGCWVWLLLMAAGAYAAYLFALPLYEFNSFESDISEMMPLYRGLPAHSVQKNIIEMGKEYDLELKPEQVKVQLVQKNSRLVIDIEYTRDVELPYYTHTLTFRPHLTGSAF